MESKPITNTESIINSGDLRTRISWLKHALNYRLSEEYSKELKVLNAFERNIVDIQLISLDQIEEQIQRTLEDLELNLVFALHAQSPILVRAAPK